MTVSIRSLATEDVDEVVALALRAWRPVFESFEQVLGSRIYKLVYPDWLDSQAKAVESVCRDENNHVWVAELDARLTGFVAVVFHGDMTGEIDMLAVDPDCQRQGVGAALTTFALERISAAGMAVAVVGTGGDPGHAPARRTYEKAGFTGLPLVRYYKAL
ncbi:GNAT family N-acetyltransferase [Actinopolymorpha alba]|uniref:GNAT family N-acetyltransferase n=1 Tax=Actinopolymorpha alba TaxID=533267 RepID=UPI00036F8DE3|nr:GNAT family N-acetyltransferase [Actinopolymorpha alba]